MIQYVTLHSSSELYSTCYGMLQYTAVQNCTVHVTAVQNYTVHVTVCYTTQQFRIVQYMLRNATVHSSAELHSTCYSLLQYTAARHMTAGYTAAYISTTHGSRVRYSTQQNSMIVSKSTPQQKGQYSTTHDNRAHFSAV